MNKICQLVWCSLSHIVCSIISEQTLQLTIMLGFQTWTTPNLGAILSNSLQMYPLSLPVHMEPLAKPRHMKHWRLMPAVAFLILQHCTWQEWIAEGGDMGEGRRGCGLKAVFSGNCMILSSPPPQLKMRNCFIALFKLTSFFKFIYAQ